MSAANRISDQSNNNSSSSITTSRRPSSGSMNSSGNNDDQVAPLEKMQARLSIGGGYVPSGAGGKRSSSFLDTISDDGSLSHRRLFSSITRDSDIDSIHDSSISVLGDGAVAATDNNNIDEPCCDAQAFEHSRRHSITGEDSYISETEIQFKGEDEFGQSILQNVRNLPDSLRLLRRTRAISALAIRLMESHDEAGCIEEASRLLILMFDLPRVSYGMVTGTDKFLLKRVNAKRNRDAYDSSTPSLIELDVMDSDFERPLEGTACGLVCQTLKQHYAPRTNESPFDTHQQLWKIGFKSTLTTPILVNGRKCAGAILIPKEIEDGFSKQDRVLISDIASILGSNLYSKRLRKATEESHKLSREILHAFVPAKVLEKIECYWGGDEVSRSTRVRRRRSDKSFGSNSTGNSIVDDEPNVGSNAWYVANFDWSEAEKNKFKRKRKASNGANGVQSKIELLRNMNRDDDDSGDDVGVIVQPGLGIDLSPTHALYAENAKNVCIVFTDIVGFSRISMDIAPIKVMDMLQTLFNRFDELCDLHGVMKLETIGDAYICATNLLEDDDSDAEDNSPHDAAMRALAIAKDMICEARNVIIPYPVGVGGMHDAWVGQNAADFETLEIRVGIHCGDVTCGVLGLKMPKFMVCGAAVNMAARMEQTSKPSMIRTTKEFHDLIGDAEPNWSQKEAIPLKNMGQVDTYLLDPIVSYCDHDE
jgi:class 3 adenylate cyclase